MLLIPIIPPFLIADWDNYQFIIFAGLPAIFFGIHSIHRHSLSIPILWSDLAWFPFLGLGFCSFFWAVNGALIWNPAFGWLGLVLWMLMFRSQFQTPNQALYFTLIIGISGLLSLLLILAVLGFEELKWKDYIGYHKNYISSYVLGLYPFLLFAQWKHRLFPLIKILGAGLVLFILIKMNSRAAGFIFLGLWIFYFWANQESQKMRWTLSLGLLSISIIAGLYYFEVESIREVPMLGEFDDANEWDRWYMVRNSFWLFLEHPWSGIGLGNWHLEAYKYGVSELAEMNNPTKLYRLGNHNIYSQHFAELGLFGGITFIYAFGKILWTTSQKIRQLSPLHQAAFGSVVVFLATSFFYVRPNFHPNYFSGLALVSFCSLGILSSQISAKYLFPLWAKRSLFVLALLAFGWYVYSKQTFDKAKFAFNLPEKYASMTIREWESIYHPTFNTTYRGRFSIDLELALLYKGQLKYDRAADYFQKALALAPNNEFVLINYSQFLLEQKKDFPLAKKYIEQLYQIQPNHYFINFLMSKVAKKEGNLELSKQCLEIYEKHKKKN